jgi:hypothetical protein
MKRMMFLMSVLVTVLLPSCNKENKEENADCSLCREYGITGLDAGSVYTAPGVDTSQMFFSGLKSGKVWIGGYDRSSKKQIFDYTFPEFPKQEFTVNIGYGETATCKINNYNIRTALNWENNTVIILGGMGIANNSTQDNVHF